MSPAHNSMHVLHVLILRSWGIMYIRRWQVQECVVKAGPTVRS
jgi:hypothetical protein